MGAADEGGVAQGDERGNTECGQLSRCLAPGGEGRQWPYERYTLALVLAILLTVMSVSHSSRMLLDVGCANCTDDSVDPLHRRPEIANAPPRVVRVGDGGGGVATIPPNANATTPSKYGEPMTTKKAGETDPTPWVWDNAGGKFGLSSNWREAVLATGGGEREATMRGEKCMTAEKQEQVQKILERRSRTSLDGKVAACVRTKDFGRFLPEWIAYHYAIGVDEISVFDDDSVDDTREVLEPFIKTGIVNYTYGKLETRSHQMAPLNDCLARYQRQQRERLRGAPAWILFHDTDEYIFPSDTSLTISETLQAHNATCCLEVKRVQYGSGGHRETPRGLTLENFLTHASETASKLNRLPKIVVNLEPSQPELGVVIPPLPSMHGAKGCTCDKVSLADMRINHYLGSIGDFMDKTRRYWQENHSVEKVEKYMADRDVNDETSDAISHWACATREILARINEGLDLKVGQTFPAGR